MIRLAQATIPITGQDDQPVGGNIIGTLEFPTSRFESLTDFGNNVIDQILIVAGGLVIISIVYSGILFITAGGDTAKAEKAKKGLIWSITGLALILAALIIIRFVRAALEGII